jgi:hypothetical protein
LNKNTFISETANDYQHYLFIDGIVAKPCSSLSYALEEMFGFYFMLDIEYPHAISLTMEFMQRLFLKKLADVSRGKKRRVTAINRVLELIVAVC